MSFFIFRLLTFTFHSPPHAYGVQTRPSTACFHVSTLCSSAPSSVKSIRHLIPVRLPHIVPAISHSRLDDGGSFYNERLVRGGGCDRGEGRTGIYRSGGFNPLDALLHPVFALDKPLAPINVDSFGPLSTFQSEF